MSLRKRDGRWHYRFQVHGHEYTGNTGLEATKRNRNAATQMEVEACKTVLDGRAWQLRLEIKPFGEAAAMYLAWCDGEYREHPNTARRIRTSFASLTEFIGNRAVSAITTGHLEDFKAWRREIRDGVPGVRDVTIRHDLHALSGFFKYAIKHNWARHNPVAEVEIPSDAGAVRIHVLSPAEEMLYFDACVSTWKTKDKRGRDVRHGPFQNLHDVGRLMLDQGMRPEEVLSLAKEAVDLEGGKVVVWRGKSAAARRTLSLTPDSRSILARRMSLPGSWVFGGKRGGTHATKLNNSHGVVLKKTGLRFVMYDLRHTFATRMAERGMPLPDLAAILGHANLRTLQKYIHVSQAQMDSAMMRFGVSENSVRFPSGFRPVSTPKEADLPGSSRIETDKPN
jgi:integrase